MTFFVLYVRSHQIIITEGHLRQFWNPSSPYLVSKRYSLCLNPSPTSIIHTSRSANRPSSPSSSLPDLQIAHHLHHLHFQICKSSIISIISISTSPTLLWITSRRRSMIYWFTIPFTKIDAFFVLLWFLLDLVSWNQRTTRSQGFKSWNSKLI